MSTSLKDRNLTISSGVRCRWRLTDHPFIGFSVSNFSFWMSHTGMTPHRPAKASPCRDCHQVTQLGSTPCHPPGWSGWQCLSLECVLGAHHWNSPSTQCWGHGPTVPYCCDSFPGTASVGRRVISCRCYSCPEPLSALPNKCHISPQEQHSGSRLSPLINWLWQLELWAGTISLLFFS